MSSESLHEARTDLSDATVDRHRAYVSLIEELEAADWYQQRAEACKDAQLRAILEHNRDEELEHASMVLEWLRREVGKLDEMLRKYLFTDADIVHIEEAHEQGDGAADPAARASSGRPGGLRIGNLRGAGGRS